MRLGLSAHLILLALGAPSVARADAWADLDLPVSIQKLFKTSRWDKTPAGFRIVALSFVADGCVAVAAAHPAAKASARKCVELAHSLAEPLAHNSRDGLPLSHLNLILGAGDQLGSCLAPEEHARLSEQLSRISFADPLGHAPSFANQKQRWPADQAATLASLHRFEAVHEQGHFRAALVKWRDAMSRIETDLGLPWSEATGAKPTSKLPRGCALSWQTRYLAEFDKALAQRWWEAYEKHFLVDRVALVGFREWPPGVDRQADIDSGPIVGGVGAAATGLGIAAARAMGRDGLAERLRLTAKTVDVFAWRSPKLKKAAHTVLADSIRYLGAHLRAR